MTPEVARALKALRSRKRNLSDSPTYLKLTGQISESERRRRVDAKWSRLDLPPIKWNSRSKENK